MNAVLQLDKVCKINLAGLIVATHLTGSIVSSLRIYTGYKLQPRVSLDRNVWRPLRFVTVSLLHQEWALQET